MCRLFAYAATTPRTLVDVMGESDLAEFVALSRLHADGWGAAWLSSAGDDWAGVDAASHVQLDRGNAIARLRSTLTAKDDPGFGPHTHGLASTVELLHMRWASAGMPVELDNQHPFATFPPASDDEAAFAHNGTIAWTPALTAVGNRQWRAAGVEAPQWGGNTDSEKFLWLIRGYHANGADWATAVGQACRAIRCHAEEPCAVNAMLLVPAQLIVVRGTGGRQPNFDDVTQELPRDHADGYYDMWLRRDADTVAVTSSGISTDGWEPLPDESLVVIDTATLAATTISFDQF